MDHPSLLSSPVAPPIVFQFDPMVELGRGTFGVVYHGINTATGEALAIKKMSLVVYNPAAVRSTLDRERVVMETLRNVRSPFLMGIYDIFEPAQDPRHVYVIMQRVQSTSLDDYLTEFAPPRSEIHRIMRQITMGLRVLHHHNLAHRDIKPANISYDYVNQIAVIIDFGFAIKSESEYLEIDAGSAYIGTPLYMPPECILMRSQQPFRHDIYSLGATFYELFARRCMYPTCSSLSDLRLAMTQRRCSPTKTMTREEADLFLLLTASRACDRPTIDVVCDKIGAFFMPVIGDLTSSSSSVGCDSNSNSNS